jgi:hypothetical protein
MQPVDEYALMEWLKGEALKAHEKANVPRGTKGSTEGERHGHYMQEMAYNKVITHIQNGRKNARPHVKERI